MKYKLTKTLAPFNLTPAAMAVFESCYAPGSIKEAAPEQVATVNKRMQWRANAAAEKKAGKK